jgi:hypothetical protein
MKEPTDEQGGLLHHSVSQAVRNMIMHTLRATSGIFRVTTIRNLSFAGVDAMLREMSVLLHFVLEGNLDKSAQFFVDLGLLIGCSVWRERNDAAF